MLEVKNFDSGSDTKHDEQIFHPLEDDEDEEIEDIVEKDEEQK